MTLAQPWFCILASTSCGCVGEARGEIFRFERGWQNCSKKISRLFNGYVTTYGKRMKGHVCLYAYFSLLSLETHFITKFPYFWPFFGLLPYVVTYPLSSLLIFLEQFCHPLPNKLDHCELAKFAVTPNIINTGFCKNLVLRKPPTRSTLSRCREDQWRHIVLLRPHSGK